MFLEGLGLKPSWKNHPAKKWTGQLLRMAKMSFFQFWHHFEPLFGILKKMVMVHELGFADCPKAFVFRGDKELKPEDVQG